MREEFPDICTGDASFQSLDPDHQHDMLLHMHALALTAYDGREGKSQGLQDCRTFLDDLERKIPRELRRQDEKRAERETIISDFEWRPKRAGSVVPPQTVTSVYETLDDMLGNQIFPELVGLTRVRCCVLTSRLRDLRPQIITLRLDKVSPKAQASWADRMITTKRMRWRMGVCKYWLDEELMTQICELVDRN
jgi:hypothetical protein